MTFYFYDLETSGVSPRTSRIMQFGGQRTDMDLNPVGEPDNILVKITSDVLPEPDAVMVTGITPQMTLTDGISEAELAKYLTSQVFLPDTIIVGFNSIRFDDEFIRHLFWRNFHDPYEWHWKDGRSRWDLLDLARMTRALRPEGIKWPFASDGRASNRLELLSSINGLDHASAHDALSDVQASIAVARLIKQKQPKLFDYLLKLRNKQEVEVLAGRGKPIVYTSGRYPSEYEKTTIAVRIGENPFKKGALMYDLRIDPDKFTKLSPSELAGLWSQWGKDAPYFPIKTLTYNRCPAVAPLSVLDDEAEQRLKLDMNLIKENLAKLQKAEDFGDKLLAALETMQPKKQAGLVADEQKVDEQLYEGFVSDADKSKMSVVRAADANKLADLDLDFADDRLKVLLPLYKARNFARSLSADEERHWEEFRKHKLLDGGENSKAARYFKRLSELNESVGADPAKKYLLEELNLYGQLVVPLS